MRSHMATSELEIGLWELSETASEVRRAAKHILLISKLIAVSRVKPAQYMQNS